MCLSFVVACLLPASLYAQQKKVENLPNYDYAKYHFGFILGVNQMNFTLKPAADLNTRMFDSTYVADIFADSAMMYVVEPVPTFGFTVGIVGNLRLGQYLDLRFIPALSFGERYIDFSIMKYKGGSETLLEIRKSIPSTYIDLPLSVRYKSKRHHNFRSYLLGGVDYNIDLASEAKKKKEQDLVRLKLKKNDLRAEIGVGFEFYNEWFKFGTEIKMGYGLPDLLKREDNIYSASIEKLTSKVFLLSFTFE